MALKRIGYELEASQGLSVLRGTRRWPFTEWPDGKYVVTLVDNDPFKWLVTFRGPQESPYQDAVVTLHVVIPSDYPYKAPTIRVVTKLYHCNINKDGGVGALYQLSREWQPNNCILDALERMFGLLTEPDGDYVQVPEIWNQLQNDRIAHDREAREWVQKYAAGPMPEVISLARYYPLFPGALVSVILRDEYTAAGGLIAVCTNLGGSEVARFPMDLSQNVGELRAAACELIQSKVQLVDKGGCVVDRDNGFPDECLLSDLFQKIAARGGAAIANDAAI